MSSWHTCHINDITCPTTTSEKVGKFLTMKEQSLQQYSNSLLKSTHPKIEGIDCYKVELSTTCISRLFTSNTIMYKKDIKTIDMASCEGIGTTTDLSYPSPVCQWHPFNDNPHTVSVSQVYSEKREYDLDLYTGRIKNENRLFEYCNKNSCVYRGKQGIFIKQIKKNKRGDEDVCNLSDHSLSREIKGKIVENGERMMMEIQGKEIDMTDICLFSRCGLNFIYIKDHTIYKVNESSNFPTCKEEELSVEDEVTFNLKLDQSTECENTLHKLHYKKMVTYKDLKSLTPSTIGVHKIYNLTTDNKLDCNLAYYSKFSYDDLKKGKYEEKWHGCGNYTLCSANGKVSQDMIKHNLSEALEFYNLYEDEIATSVIVDYRSMSNVNIKSESKITHTDSVLLDFFKINWVWIGEIALIILVTYLVLKKLLSCKTYSSKDKVIKLRNSDWV